jgi:uncharacterized membrane protein
MRSALIAALSWLALSVAPAVAADNPPNVKGMFLMTDYPAVSVQPGTTSTVSLQLHNYAMAPERLALSVDGVPKGWTATLMGGGKPVAAAMPGTDSSVSLDLRLEVPKGTPIGSHTLTIAAKGPNTSVSLPVDIMLAKNLPAKLTLTPQLPELRGSAKSSFDYTLAVKNDSGKKLLVSLSAQAPKNFDTSFTEEYGSQELTAVPIDAGQSKNVKLKVRPPSTVASGSYPVSVKVAAEDASASSKVTLQVNGQPKLDIAGREGLVSGRASAGQETSIPIEVLNTGSAPASDVRLSGSAPSGWKIEFNPKVIPSIAPNDHKEVQALITPTEKAIAGDYVTSISADSRGENASTNFRITVTTSTLWGIAGVGIIGVALLIMVGAVARFGRR